MPPQGRKRRRRDTAVPHVGERGPRGSVPFGCAEGETRGRPTTLAFWMRVRADARASDTGRGVCGGVRASSPWPEPAGAAPSERGHGDARGQRHDTTRRRALPRSGSANTRSWWIVRGELPDICSPRPGGYRARGLLSGNKPRAGRRRRRAAGDRLAESSPRRSCWPGKFATRRGRDPGRRSSGSPREAQRPSGPRARPAGRTAQGSRARAGGVGTSAASSSTRVRRDRCQINLARLGSPLPRVDDPNFVCRALLRPVEGGTTPRRVRLPAPSTDAASSRCAEADISTSSGPSRRTSPRGRAHAARD